jgi:uncharacterized protein
MRIDELRQKAAAGNLAAQSILGICYLEGIDVEVDYEEAFRLLSLAAQRGAARARAHLARMYAEGLGVTRDESIALTLYESAANAGEFMAQIGLARMFSRRNNADHAQALKWYSAAVTQQDRIGECAEIEEARDYIDKRSKATK